MDLTDLPSTATNVYVVGVDASGNRSELLTIPIASTVGPTLTNGQESARAATTATVTFDSDEAGQYAYMVATDEPDDTAIMATTLVEMAKGTNTIKLTELDPAATSVWIMGKDEGRQVESCY